MKQFTNFLLFAVIALLLVSCNNTADAATAPPFVETGIDSDAWRLIPAGEFYRGLNDHETAVDYDYEMMVTAVTNQQYADYLNTALNSDTIKIQGDDIVGYYPGDAFHAHEHEVEIAAGEWPHLTTTAEGLRLDFDGEVFTAQSSYANHPMVLVTWFGAKAYCEFNDWRLPTEFEWEKGARGHDKRSYPWGDDIQRENANFYGSRDPFEANNGKLGDTTPVGFYSGLALDGYETIDSPSPYGLYDMAGNVWQWTEDIYTGSHMRTMRGGSKADFDYNLRIGTRNNAGPDYASTNVGFRCVR